MGGGGRTQLIPQLHSVIDCQGNSAPVLWLNPVSLVYSGTGNLQPPLALPLSLTFFSLSLFLSPAVFPLFSCSAGLYQPEDEESICCLLSYACV